MKFKVHNFKTKLILLLRAGLKNLNTKLNRKFRVKLSLYLKS